MDSDGQHPARELSRLVAPIQDGTADIVKELQSNYNNAGVRLHLLQAHILALYIILTSTIPRLTPVPRVQSMENRLAN